MHSDYLIAPNEQGSEHCIECGILVTKVKDTGTGISKDIEQRLFRMFDTAQRNKRMSSALLTTQGVGLGLTICKQIVYSMGGFIRVNTTVGLGTEVSFSIPIKC